MLFNLNQLIVIENCDIILNMSMVLLLIIQVIPLMVVPYAKYICLYAS